MTAATDTAEWHDWEDDSRAMTTETRTDPLHDAEGSLVLAQLALRHCHAPEARDALIHITDALKALSAVGHIPAPSPDLLARVVEGCAKIAFEEQFRYTRNTWRAVAGRIAGSIRTRAHQIIADAQSTPKESDNG